MRCAIPAIRSLVLEVATRMIFPLIMVWIFFFTASQHARRWCCQVGLTAGLALVLRYLAGGRYELGETRRSMPGRSSVPGHSSSGLRWVVLGAPVLSSAVISVNLPLLGLAKFVTALFFDLGVYLIWWVGVVCCAASRRAIDTKMADAVNSR